MDRAAGVGRARPQDRRAPGDTGRADGPGGRDAPSSAGVASSSGRRLVLGRRLDAVLTGPPSRGDRKAILVGGRRRERLGIELAGRQLLDVRGQLRDPALDDRLGEQGVGFGLEIGDLGLEFQPDDLALDRGVGRRQRLCISWGRAGSTGLYSPLIQDRRRLREARAPLLATEDRRVDGGQARNIPILLGLEDGAT